ncbi:MAG: prepilin peptidase [Clostridia bacterium]|nr:prepilin peptidase [Clostridia bacterium]
MILQIVRGILLAGLLLYGSIHDIRTHTMPDWVWLGVAGTALLGMKLSALPSMLLGALAVLVIEVPLAVMLKDRAIGGADIKLSAAGAFLLGWQKGLAALILGLALSLIVIPVVRRIRHEDNRKAFPLVPFLAVGIMTAYLT